MDPWLRDRRYPNERELAGYLGSERDGGFAQYCSVPSENVYPVSTELSDVELASFACSWSTAEHMLQRVNLSAGETIAVPGASGRSRERPRAARQTPWCRRCCRGRCLQAGSESSNSGLTRRLPERPRTPSRPQWKPTEGPSIQWPTSSAGTTSEAGSKASNEAVVTSPPAPSPVRSWDLDLRTLYLRDLQLHGATIYEPKVFADLVGYIEAGQVRPVVGGTFPLEQIHDAQEAFGSKDHVGSMVITIPAQDGGE